MHLEVDETLVEKSGTHFLRFGKLRGSAIVDERTGRVKEYKLPLLGQTANMRTRRMESMRRLGSGSR